mgnify:CR=1 FL=1
MDSKGSNEGCVGLHHTAFDQDLFGFDVQFTDDCFHLDEVVRCCFDNEVVGPFIDLNSPESMVPSICSSSVAVRGMEPSKGQPSAGRALSP